MINHPNRSKKEQKEGIDFSQADARIMEAFARVERETNRKIEKCCICGFDFYGYGHNPAPVRDKGRCCDICNSVEVIPARIRAIYAGGGTVE